MLYVVRCGNRCARMPSRLAAGYPRILSGGSTPRALDGPCALDFAIDASTAREEPVGGHYT